MSNERDKKQVKGEGMGEFKRKKEKWERGDEVRVTTRNPGKKGDPLARSRDRR